MIDSCQTWVSIATFPCAGTQPASSSGEENGENASLQLLRRNYYSAPTVSGATQAKLTNHRAKREQYIPTITAEQSSAYGDLSGNFVKPNLGGPA